MTFRSVRYDACDNLNILLYDFFYEEAAAVVFSSELPSAGFESTSLQRHRGRMSLVSTVVYPYQG